MSDRGIIGSEAMGLCWYVLSTKVNHEKRVEQQVRRIGIESFLPLFKEQRAVRNQSKSVIAPLFPGYVFVRANLLERYRVLVYTRGVHRIVAFGPTPAVVDSLIIASIKDKMTNSKAYSIKQSVEVKSGQLVRITDGPLTGGDAVFVRNMSGGQRAMVLLRTLAAQSRAVIDTDQLVSCIAA